MTLSNMKYSDRSLSAFHFPELAGQIGQSVNPMRQFEGMVLPILDK